MRPGRSDAQIKRFLTDRYGEFVLLTPALLAGNLALWGGPFLVVAAGRGPACSPPAEPIRRTPELSPEEAERVRAAVAKRFRLT